MMKKFFNITLVNHLIVLNFFVFQNLNAQKLTTNQLLGQVNTITTAVPFLLIAPDSRSGSMGDAGVATTPDINSQHWNPSKYAFIKNDFGAAISYTPWLRALVDDINIAYLSGYKRMDKTQTISASLLYFSLGDITFTNIVGDITGQFRPNEFSIDGAYSRMFSKKISGGIVLRYIYSNLTGGQFLSDGTSSHVGHSVASDVSAYYQSDIKINKRDAVLGIGVNISNIGSKISYTENQDKDFLPTNLRLGAALTTQIDEYNSLMITCDFNKLMVPSPPRYYKPGEITLDGKDTIAPGEKVIKYGSDPNVSVPVGMFRSFYDAPGIQFDDGTKTTVFREEMDEINISCGLEYWYAKQFALRAGYFHENQYKGNRQFYTLGLGLRLNVFGLDFSYLIPTHQQNPLANTLRFTLIFDFAQFNKQGE